MLVEIRMGNVNGRARITQARRAGNQRFRIVSGSSWRATSRNGIDKSQIMIATTATIGAVPSAFAKWPGHDSMSRPATPIENSAMETP